MRQNLGFYILLVLTLFFCVALALAPACSGVTQTIKSWTGAFAGCEKQDLGQIIKNGDTQATLLNDVASIIEGNNSTLEADLTAIALQAGKEAVRCAIVAYESVIMAPRGSAAPRVVPQGLVRAKAWLGSAS